MSEPLENEVDEQVEGLGYELVDLERAGSKNRPILRLRIDRPDSTPGDGVTVEDCRVVSRHLENWLEERPDIPSRYVLEVSSPGVERPLIRDRDFRRFQGQEIALSGKAPIHGNRKKVQGELIGLGAEGDTIALRLEDGTELTIPRQDVKANLVYRWGG